jgi:Domain of unknown function (DUF1707)
VLVMAGLGDDKAAGAAGRGCLPASYDQREQVIDALKAAFIQGRLDKDEFDLRLGQAFTSRTYAELVAVTADLPAGLSAAQPPTPDPAPRVGPLIMALSAVEAGLWAFVFLAPNRYVDHKGVFFLVGIFTFVYVGMLILAGIVTLESRDKERPRGQLPPRPALDLASVTSGQSRLLQASPSCLVRRVSGSANSRPARPSGQAHRRAARSRVR